MPECNRNMCMCVKKARPLIIRQSDSMFAGNSHQPTHTTQLRATTAGGSCFNVLVGNELE